MLSSVPAVLQIELDEEGREVELGKGAFGVVVKGRYRLSPVAVKRLINQTQEQQAQFLKEMAILRACRGSRYIVPFVGASLQPVSASPLCHDLDLEAPVHSWFQEVLYRKYHAPWPQTHCTAGRLFLWLS